MWLRFDDHVTHTHANTNRTSERNIGNTRRLKYSALLRNQPQLTVPKVMRVRGVRLLKYFPSRQRYHLSAFKRNVRLGLNVSTVRQQKRTILSDVIPAVLVPPVVFGGLVVTLWIYKCCMMVLFQNKIIYMPSVPPFSRREKMADYANICRPVHWEEKRIRSLDGTEVALCVGGIENSADRSNKEVIVLYFQGYVSS